MKKSVLALLLMLGVWGCAPHPETRIQPVHCITVEQYKRLLEAEPAKIGNATTGDLGVDYATSVKQNVLVRKYADGVLEVLGGCIGYDK
jgi:hypothetical protein